MINIDNINIYYANIKNLDLRKISQVPKFRQNTILSYKFDIDQKRSLGAWLLVKKMLEKNYNKFDSEHASSIAFNKNGKPYIKNCDLKFNLSHSGDYAMCAWGFHEIGCDIQKIIKVDSNIFEHCMTKDEVKEIFCCNNNSEEISKQYPYIDECDTNCIDTINVSQAPETTLHNKSINYRTFFRYWSIKESYIKADSNLKLNNLTKIEAKKINGIKEFTIDKNYCSCVCVPDSSNCYKINLKEYDL